jgi:Ni2+-binding GTPase involved in maturation of urease and hydrogenase
MQLIIMAGAPSVGKTAVLLKTLNYLIHQLGLKASVAKMDCLQSKDAELFSALHIPTTTGLSKDLCPDHYLAINLNSLYDWAQSNDSNMLVIETAGLCNRCAPFLSGALNICVIDATASIKSPEKLGPMVTTADIISITKCDMISQAEREILIEHLEDLNPQAQLIVVNGLTGAGTKKLALSFQNQPAMCQLEEQSLLYQMPGAICSYCVGEKRIGKQYHQGMVDYMQLGGSK